MARLHTLLFLSLLIFSCSTKKLSKIKSVVDTKIDSVVVEKKESVAVTQNAISTKEIINELEIVPIDTAKPLVIDGKKYFNATVRFKKINRQVIDTTKVVSTQAENKVIEVKKEGTRKDLDKKLKKTSPSFIWVWIVLIVVIAGIVIRYVLK